MSSGGRTFTFAFSRASAKGLARLDDASDRNIEDLKRRAESIFDDPDKLQTIEKLCRLLTRRFKHAT